MNIDKILKNWQSESIFGERYFKKQNFSLVKDQNLYLIKISANVNISGNNKTIVKQKFFQTYVQGANIDSSNNKKGDEYICKKILAQLEDEFFKDYNTFIEEEIKRISNTEN
tara:strand:+ start:1059 stop:1394 length:336 start_codon:yes stop_codon:yes gene_type:complete